MLKLSYRLSRGETTITLGNDAISSLGELEDSLVVCPRSLRSMAISMLKGSFSIAEIDDGEDSKTLDTVVKILDKLMDGGFRRNSRLISFGGGTASDVAGFAASLYLRGIRYTSIPTTLLSMVDASLGGKNGVNYRGVKNVLGSFYSPSDVFVDTSIVSGMPHNLIEDGIGEIAKYATIMDRELYSFLMENTMDGILEDREKTEYMISKCIRDKMGLVSQDEFDQEGRRVILNFGHTFGHALEGVSEFSIGHGHAVLGGMLFETDYGAREGLISPEVGEGLHKLIRHLGFSTKEVDYLPGTRNELLKYIASDKKSTRRSIKMPLPERIGIPKVCDVELSSISDYLDHD